MENNNWIKDLIAAQKEMPMVEKDGKNPHFKNDYAKYDTAVEVIKKVYNKNNFFVSHEIKAGYSINNKEDGHKWEETIPTKIITKIIHTSGKEIFSSMPLINKAGTDQGMGSSISYAKRYTLLALVAVASSDEDDDGEAANVPQQLAKEIFKEVRNNKAEPPKFDQSEDINFDDLPSSLSKGDIKVLTGNTGDTIFNEGQKHKGRSFDDIIKSDIGYIKYMSQKPDLKGQIADLIDYAISLGIIE